MPTPKTGTKTPENPTDEFPGQVHDYDPSTVGTALDKTRFSDDQLAEIESFDDALTLLAEAGETIDSAAEVLGNGFTVVQDKGILCGVEMLLIEWRFNVGDNGEFVSANAVVRFPGQKTPAKFVINDGSTGIRDQLRRYTEKTGKTRGLHVKGGLTRSDYTYEDPNTKESKQATTYYLNLSA